MTSLPSFEPMSVSLLETPERNMSGCMTPSTKKLIGGALLAIIGLGLVFLAHYHFSEAWSSIYTIVPLAVGSAALTYLAIKVYRQWGVEEKSYEIADFIDDIEEDGSHLINSTPFFYNGNKVNYQEWIKNNVASPQDREYIEFILENGLSHSFKQANQKMLGKKNFVVSRNVDHPDRYNIRGKEGNWVVEIHLQKEVTNERLKYKLITDVQVNITTHHASCTTSLIPL